MQISAFTNVFNTLVSFKPSLPTSPQCMRHVGELFVWSGARSSSVPQAVPENSGSKCVITPPSECPAGLGVLVPEISGSKSVINAPAHEDSTAVPGIPGPKSLITRTPRGRAVCPTTASSSRATELAFARWLIQWPLHDPRGGPSLIVIIAKILG